MSNTAKVGIVVLAAFVSFGARANDGDFARAKSMGGGMADAGNGIAADSAGNVYTTGYFNDSGDFDPGPVTFTLTAIPGLEFTTFISKLDRNGNFVCAKGLGGATLYTEGG